MPDHPLVSTGWLHANLSRADVRIVDVRGHVLPASAPLPHYYNHYDEYCRSHIPGAVFVDWVHEITDPDSFLHARLAPPERFAAVMRRLGIGGSTLVVAYDDANSMFAARLWWALQYHGHESVVVLDGGWQKWTAEGRPVTADIPAVNPADFTPRLNPALYRDAEAVAALPTSARLVDVRTRDEFAGQTSRVARRGHIPGAVNRPRADLVAPDGTMPPPETLRRLFLEIGVDGSESDAVFYCNAGVSASYGLLAYRCAGFSGGAVYDGSWKDWGGDDRRPIVSG